MSPPRLLLQPALMAAVRAELERSRALGFLGPGEVDDHIVHGVDFARVIAHGDGAGAGHDVPESHVVRVLDLGAGGGIPGLVLLACLPDIELTMLDAHRRRTSFLEAAVTRLDGADRARVVHARAEEAGRDPQLRHSMDVVVARSFGPPAATAECAAPFLVPGGRLIVSEPPLEHLDRWPIEGLELLGLRRAAAPSLAHRFAVLVVVEPVADRFPRRVGVPARKPLFVSRET